MRTLTMTALVAALLAAATPALGGRDDVLIRQVDQKMAAKRAAQIELAKLQQQTQTGLAGATGQPGKVGPTTEERPAGRAARQSPTDHP